MIATALSVAGSDPSGGAGVQADLKTFSARGVYGMAAITALTAQNTLGVSGVHVAPPDFVAAQIAAVLQDIRVDAVKIGMVADADVAAAVADALSGYRGPVTLDPVMVAKGGARLLAGDAAAVLATRLLPLATVATPNLAEAAALLGAPVARDRAGMAEQARALLDLGAQAVLIKGGHLEGPESPDALAARDGIIWFEGPRHATRNTHGTGCTLSAAVAAELAKGRTPVEAASSAKAYVAGAIAAADELDIGGGHGPTHHFHALWSAR